MPDVTMPRLSDSMEEGTILKWLKSDGDEVSEGDELAEIETDKATMTYEADGEGILDIVAEEGQTLAIGEVIARLRGPGEEPSDDGGGAEAEGDGAEAESGGESDETATAEPDEEDGAESADDEEAAEAPAATAEADGGDAAATEEPDEAEEPTPSGDGEHEGDGNGRTKASPVARRIARERGIDLSSLRGSGPGGRIVKADVEGAPANGGSAGAETAEEPAAAEEEKPSEAREPVGTVTERGTGKGDVTTQDPSRLQQVVARRMAESKATQPDFALEAEIDMQGCVELREQLKARLGGDAPVPSYNDMVVKAAALALREFPRANGAYRDGKFELYSRVNVGVAVAGQDALVVPTVFDADTRSLGDIARTARALAEKVREGKISPPELSGGTFTVSNLGMFGVTNFTAVINPPQAGILAVGALRQVPVVVDGRVTVGHRMEVTLTCDHRILYGADAARFLARICELLEEPLSLVL
jgi:pyruvate dehydrogenase E2 component (dihydrolipoamide acetyltransferase)